MKDYYTIMQSDKTRCWKCNERAEEMPHHIVHGTKYNKKFSEDNGLMAYLCYACHYDCHHGTARLDLKLKEAAEREYLKTHTMQDWMSFVGKNYVYE